jgi:hypothetical protein
MVERKIGGVSFSKLKETEHNIWSSALQERLGLFALSADYRIAQNTWLVSTFAKLEVQKMKL